VSEGRTMIISVKLDESTLRKIDAMVSMGRFRNRSDLIRAAIKYKLRMAALKMGKAKVKAAK